MWSLAETVLAGVVIVRNHIEARIKELRITQPVAAHRAGLDLRQLQRLIRGKHAHGPWLTTAKQLAEGLGTTIDALFVFKITRKRIHLNSV